MSGRRGHPQDLALNQEIKYVFGVFPERGRTKRRVVSLDSKLDAFGEVQIRFHTAPHTLLKSASRRYRQLAAAEVWQQTLALLEEHFSPTTRPAGDRGLRPSRRSAAQG